MSLRFAVTALLALALLTPASANAQLGLDVLEEPEAMSPLQQLDLTVPSGATDVSRRVLVRARTDEVKDVQITATAEGKAITVAVDGATNGKVTITKGGVVPVTITVPVDPNGEVKGRLEAISGQTAQTLVPFKATRPDEAVLSLEGVKDGAVTRTAETTTWTSTPFTIQSDKSEDVGDLRLSVSDLAGPGATTVPVLVRVGEAPHDPDRQYAVKGLSSLRFTIGADLSVSGEYAGTITLLYAKQKSTVVLKVTRTRVAPTVELTDPGTFQQLASGPAQFAVEARETAGRPVALGMPSVLVKRKEGAKEFTVPTRVEIDGATTGVQLKPDTTKPFDVELLDIDSPGEYSARLRFATGDTPAKEVTATLFLRWPWWIALGVLLVAAVLADVFRRKLGKRRARLTAQLTVARTRDALTAIVTPLQPFDAAELAVVDALKVRLALLVDQLDANADAVIEADRKLVADRLPTLQRWLALRRAAAAAGAGQLVWDALAKAEPYLRLEVDTAGEALNEAAQALARLPVLKGELDALAGAVASWMDEGGEAADAGTNIQSEITRAQTAFAKGDIIEADGARIAAWKAWTDAIAAQLLELLDPKTPTGVLPVTWVDLRRRTVPQLATLSGAEPAQAVATYRAIAVDLLTTLADGLSSAATALDPTVAAQADAAIAQAAAGQLDAAWDTYEEAARQWQAAQAVGTAGAAPAAPTPGMTALMRGLALSAPAPAAAAVGTSTVPLPDTAKIRARLGAVEWLVTAFSVAVAALLGLVLVYQPDPSWGGWEDVIVLFLIGLGVHTTTAATGLLTAQSVSDKLTGTTPPK